MPAKSLRDLSDQELEVKERELQEALFRLRLRRGTNQWESPAALIQTGKAGNVTLQVRIGPEPARTIMGPGAGDRLFPRAQGAQENR